LASVMGALMVVDPQHTFSYGLYINRGTLKKKKTEVG